MTSPDAREAASVVRTIIDRPPATPYVSVVVACLNSEATLERCLRSVIEQTNTAWELLVVDGGSSDGTLEIIEKVRSHIAWSVSEPDRGVYQAWNKALDHVRGRWILFLGSDDRLADPRVLELVIPQLRRLEGNVRVAYGKLTVVDASGADIATLGWPWEDIGEVFGRGMFVPHPATFHHATLLIEHGRFDESFRIAGDYEFLLRELPAHRAQLLDGPVVTLMGNAGMSHHPRSQATTLVEAHRAQRLHGFTRQPEWASYLLFKVRVRAFLFNTFGEGVADGVRGLYRLLTGKSRMPVTQTPEEGIAALREKGKKGPG